MPRLTYRSIADRVVRNARVSVRPGIVTYLQPKRTRCWWVDTPTIALQIRDGIVRGKRLPAPSVDITHPKQGG